MSREELISNSDYLKSVGSGGVFVLPHEQQILRHAENVYHEAHHPERTTEIIESALSTPEMFLNKAVQADAEIVEVRASILAPFLGAVAVDYPDELQDKVSLGSRVMLLEDEDEFVCDIVGFNKLYREDITDVSGNEVVVLPLGSPLASLIIGQSVGSSLELEVKRGNDPINVKVVSIDQLSVAKTFYENTVSLHMVEG